MISGLGTAVILTAISKALPHLATLGARTGFREAWPPLTVAVVAMATGAGMWILADWPTRRLNPKIASAADHTLVGLHMKAELPAYDTEGFTDRSQAAEIGALRAVDLAGQPTVHRPGTSAWVALLLPFCLLGGRPPCRAVSAQVRGVAVVGMTCPCGWA
ncbi:hypothetical protein [Streptomyces sp. 35G-GA-8]|uniref:hypothetical protein n=1 Tax=Streptomyces sp. 35G-GA-8 TaxID=2939434 RepID=UPI00201E7917|nr:hypothetical protein [Streptomyces sp. 35G-GA-8]MCL7379799.1 hypothetical protein [Streptomyces sp. 35G-GA-8]